MKRILVTGASGFIGRASLAPLLRRGFEVHAAARSAVRTSAAEVHWHRVDLMDEAAAAALCAAVAPSHLLHFAWYAEPGKFWTARENFAWVKASLALLAAFRAVNGTRAVIAGTCAEYDWRYGCCVENLTPLTPASTYGVCKAALAGLTDAFAREAGISAAWGRIFFPFGPYEHPERLTSYVIRSLLRGELALCTRGDQVRDFLFVDDVADAFSALADSAVQGPVNIGSGEPVSLAAFLNRIAARIGRSDLLRLGARPAAANEAPFVIADVRRLRGEIGWSPAHTIDQAVERSIGYWRQTLSPAGAGDLIQ